jgi:hypothetical protein
MGRVDEDGRELTEGERTTKELYHVGGRRERGQVR